MAGIGQAAIALEYRLSLARETESVFQPAAGAAGLPVGRCAPVPLSQGRPRRGRRCARGGRREWAGNEETDSVPITADPQLSQQTVRTIQEVIWHTYRAEFANPERPAGDIRMTADDPASRCAPGRSAPWRIRDNRKRPSCWFILPGHTLSSRTVLPSW